MDSCRLHFFRRLNRIASSNILFLHGLGTSSSTWIHVLPSLRESGSITCLDLPGHGFSKITGGDRFFPLRQMDQALEQFIQSTQHPPLHIIGHSLGGWLAARYAARHPESVEHLILIDNAGIRYEGFERQADAFTIRSVDDVRHLLELLWYRYPWYFRPFTSSIYHSLLTKQISGFIQSVQEEDFLNRSIPFLTMPLDSIWGMDDGVVSKKSVDIMKKLAPHLREHFIPRCGHVPQLERPRELTLLLAHILASS